MELNKEAFEAGLLGRPVEKEVMEKAAFIGAAARILLPLGASIGSSVAKTPLLNAGLRHTAKSTGKFGKGLHSFLNKANTPGTWQSGAMDFGLPTIAGMGTSAIVEKVMPEQQQY